MFDRKEWSRLILTRTPSTGRNDEFCFVIVTAEIPASEDVPFSLGYMHAVTGKGHEIVMNELFLIALEIIVLGADGHSVGFLDSLRVVG